MSVRTKIIAGNWKMNKTIEESLELVKQIHYGLNWPGEVDVIVAPPFTAIREVASFLKDSYIHVAVQNIHWEDKGAFTGEISAPMAKNAGADFAIVGHSERRKYFGETDEIINKKIKAGLRNSLIPIVCVGETLEERDAGKVEEVIKTQIEGCLNGLSNEEVSKIVIAYEPVWAIGTGKTASPQQAEEVHAQIRSIVERKFGENVSNSLKILYGGSVTPSTSKELMAQENIDGALVGGASLKAQDFIEIIKSANIIK